MVMPRYVEEDFETLIVGSMVFEILMCGVFDILNKLNILRVLDNVLAKKTIIGR